MRERKDIPLWIWGAALMGAALMSFPLVGPAADKSFVGATGFLWRFAVQIGLMLIGAILLAVHFIRAAARPKRRKSGK